MQVFNKFREFKISEIFTILLWNINNINLGLLTTRLDASGKQSPMASRGQGHSLMMVLDENHKTVTVSEKFSFGYDKKISLAEYTTSVP